MSAMAESGRSDFGQAADRFTSKLDIQTTSTVPGATGRGSGIRMAASVERDGSLSTRCCHPPRQPGRSKADLGVAEKQIASFDPLRPLRLKSGVG
jgi:hypothetical protein